MPNPWVLLAGAAATVLAAIFTLIGVHYGQWLQTQRERENRAELWKREDRHRFTMHKSELYSNLIGSLDRWLKDLKAVNVDQLSNNSGQRNSIDQWLNWINAPHDEIEPRRNIDILVGRVRLVSQQMWQRVDDQVDLMDVATFELASGGDEADSDLPAIERSLQALADSMRAELNGEDSN
ncbi:hypothetical protein ACFWN2_21045 [Lentzea sp. NPDC058436]|uniref:hypothetical protein n=1 Tax=Lentzea sp. NPDC058436 TaxID=3346499 RepID=UPI00366151E1